MHPKPLPYMVVFYIFVTPFVFSQQVSIKDYLDTAKDYAVIYSGEVEEGYNPYFHENFPYYQTQNYAPGDLIYDDILYTHQKMRLDLYKEQLIILLPEKQYGKIVSPDKVNRIKLHDKEFIFHNSTENKELKNGYYYVMHEGERMFLVGKQTFQLTRSFQNSKFSFKKQIAYYLLLDGKSHTVKNQRIFYKLFPQCKEQIKRLVKENNLNFSKDKETGLSVLAAYCEEWLTKNDFQ